jgi:hypothetical protein
MNERSRKEQSPGGPTPGLFAYLPNRPAHAVSRRRPGNYGNELPKCANGIGEPAACFGPNGEIRQFAERNILGPVHDVLSGQIGQSSESGWGRSAWFVSGSGSWLETQGAPKKFPTRGLLCLTPP